QSQTIMAAVPILPQLSHNRAVGAVGGIIRRCSGQFVNGAARVLSDFEKHLQLADRRHSVALSQVQCALDDMGAALWVLDLYCCVHISLQSAVYWCWSP